MSKNADHAEQPVVNYLLAAEAAQQRGDEARANQHLERASELSTKDPIPLRSPAFVCNWRAMKTMPHVTALTVCWKLPRVIRKCCVLLSRPLYSDRCLGFAAGHYPFHGESRRGR